MWNIKVRKQGLLYEITSSSLLLPAWQNRVIFNAREYNIVYASMAAPRRPHIQTFHNVTLALRDSPSTSFYKDEIRDKRQYQISERHIPSNGHYIVLTLTFK